MKKLLSNLFHWEVNHKTIPLILFLLLSCNCITAQTKVTGVVKDDKGLTVPGVNISVVGSQKSASSDFDGTYSIDAPANATLQFAFVGFETKRVSINGQSIINVNLHSSAEDLKEVVVVGYGTMRKSDVTGSVSKVNATDLHKATSVDAAKALQGRVAGVNVISNSGSPGAGVKIRIRGVGTINNSDPLYVVDGFPMSDIQHIAPTDIESMEVLKDASATAIYGSRGANGVILIKTRAGSKSGKFDVSATVLTGVSEVSKRLDLADATEFANARKSIGMTDDIINYVLDQQAAGNYLKGTDWQKYIYQQAISTRYNIGISGHTDNYSYDTGVTISDEEGIVKGTELTKFMFHSNNNIKLTDKIKFGMNYNYVHYEKPGSGTSDFYNGTIPGALRSDPISVPFDSYTGTFGEIYYSPSQRNPALSIDLENNIKNIGNRVMGNFYLQFDDIFVKGLSFRSQFGSTLDFNEYKQYVPKYFITPTQKNDVSNLYESRTYAWSWVNTNYFSYNKNISKLNINTTLGMELQSNESSDIWGKGYDVPNSSSLQYLGAHQNAVLFGVGGGKSQNRLESGFFRGNFAWDNKYVLTGTVRVDGSSKFLGDQRWGTFPSFAAAWNISKESFMSSIASTLSTLKLRAGWGLVGNQGSAGDFDYVSSVNGGYNYVLNGTPVEGTVQQKLANEELTWESSEQIDLGVDFGLFDNKLTGTVDYFVRNTKDMILSKPIPMYAGKQRPAVNAGTMQNKGFEFTLNYANNKHAFKYDLGLNFAVIKNEVTSLAGGDPIRSGSVGRLGNTTKTEVGREIAYFYGYQTDGLFKTQDQLDAYKKDGTAIQPNAGLGDVKFVDRNGDGKITEDDMTYLGSATPKLTGGFNVNLSYKGFDMVMFFVGSYGNETVNAMRQSLYSSKMFETNISRDMAVNSWTPANSNSNVPRLDAADLNNNTDNFSDLYVEDGSYLRLKNIQLGYTIPTGDTKKIGIKNFRIYTTIDNLMTLTKYSGLDPELYGLFGNPFYSGIDMVNYPQPTTYSVGINVNF
ncbi:TonB-dependent receptor [Flavobacterium sp. 5]|uniref:SusC/RagA family TonB-linked outer membrane protein n=1 Tax=Flavobacterium sp. 5 TaxID=2035199 RepID=UPI000C2B6AFC|nr:TonB-dependent receptor [Flavobacterium sp. 5]PKB17288.1 TonB-linked SusC/RagA family outer membrane protein [Flavobacterium sp. 5]